MLGGHRGRLAAGFASLAVAGCSLGDEETPKPVSGAPKQVVQLVDALDRAIARRDFESVCDKLFSTAARRRAGGRDCASLLRSASRDLRRSRIELLRIELKANGATARVRTRAAGQAPIDETIELVREGGRYRIAALAD